MFFQLQWECGGQTDSQLNHSAQLRRSEAELSQRPRYTTVKLQLTPESCTASLRSLTGLFLWLKNKWSKCLQVVDRDHMSNNRKDPCVSCLTAAPSPPNCWLNRGLNTVWLKETHVQILCHIQRCVNVLKLCLLMLCLLSETKAWTSFQVGLRILYWKLEINDTNIF